MKHSRKYIGVLATAAALATAGMSAHAFPGGGPGYGGWVYGGPGPGMMRGGPWGGASGMMGYGGGPRGFGPGFSGGPWANPAATAEANLAALKVELKITRDQDSAWNAFAAKARKQAETMQSQREKFFAQFAAADQSAQDRLAQRAEFAKQRAADMETMTAAVRDLYAVLTPEQKPIADQLLARGPAGRVGGPWFRR